MNQANKIQELKLDDQAAPTKGVTYELTGDNRIGAKIVDLKARIKTKAKKYRKVMKSADRFECYLKDVSYDWRSNPNVYAAKSQSQLSTKAPYSTHKANESVGKTNYFNGRTKASHKKFDALVKRNYLSHNSVIASSYETPVVDE